MGKIIKLIIMKSNVEGAYMKNKAHILYYMY